MEMGTEVRDGEGAFLYQASNTQDFPSRPLPFASINFPAPSLVPRLGRKLHS